MHIFARVHPGMEINLCVFVHSDERGKFSSVKKPVPENFLNLVSLNKYYHLKLWYDHFVSCSKQARGFLWPPEKLKCPPCLQGHHDWLPLPSQATFSLYSVPTHHRYTRAFAPSCLVTAFSDAPRDQHIQKGIISTYGRTFVETQLTCFLLPLPSPFLLVWCTSVSIILFFRAFAHFYPCLFSHLCPLYPPAIAILKLCVEKRPDVFVCVFSLCKFPIHCRLTIWKTKGKFFKTQRHKI